MPMTSLNISLPEALKEYVEGQVASGDWGTPSEYVRELIRQDKERRLGKLQAHLLADAPETLILQSPMALRSGELVLRSTHPLKSVKGGAASVVVWKGGSARQI